MTLGELSQHFRLLEQLDKAKEIAQNLRSAAIPGAQVLTGMPHAPGVRDRVGDLAVEIADMEDKIKALEAEIAENGKKVEEFIATIENDQTRTIFRLRFLRCLAWKEVAAVLGGRNTEAGVRMMCYRYMDKL